MMRLYSCNDCYKLYQGNMLDMLDVIEKNSIDSIVTDPPYELNFMNKAWDNAGISFKKETWEKCFDVLKDGGYLLAFGGSRTFHRIACAIESAGFEIRDTIMWLYGSGFPKSMNISLMLDKKEGLQGQRGIGGFNVGGIQEQNNRKAKLYIGSTTDGSKQKAYTDFKSDLAKQWKGWGTALKPSFEPIIVARKPFKGSLVDNVIKNGVGGINIDECRVGNEELHNSYAGNKDTGFTFADTRDEKGKGIFSGNKKGETVVTGRFPANTILTYNETDFEEVCGGLPNTKGGNRHNKVIRLEDSTSYGGKAGIFNTRNEFNDSGSASRYFYCAKASKKDRDEGLEDFKTITDKSKGNGLDRICEFCGVSQLKPELCHCKIKSWITKPKKNTHPTCKPCNLMQYLVRLVTPNNGIILDPFNGSGSTGKAAMYENKERNKNYKYIGIELTEEYLPISKARIEHVYNQIKDNKIQISIDDME